MARPQRLEKLRHGRLLCGSVFRFFVETWNWLTAYVDNMKGDAETDPQSGYITIDRTDPDHPVIRFRADKVAAGGGGGGGLSGTVEFVADNDWYVNGSVHQFRKRLRVLDLATGQVTDKAGTTYANGWEVVTDTTPISQIIN